jgi:SNF2 family DNA or RNA helicase
MQLNEIIHGLNIPADVILHQTPRDYQVEDYKALITNPRGANYSEVGTGKSLVSYLYLMHRMYSGEKVIILMPPGLLKQYSSEFKRIITGHPFEFTLMLKDRQNRNVAMDGYDKDCWPQILGLSYQLFIKYYKFFSQQGYYTGIICDEAHCLGNVKTKTFTSVCFFMQSKRDRSLLMMTATPMPTEIQSAYGQIKLKNPQAYVSLDQFDRMHTVYEPRMIKVRDKKGDLRERKIQTIIEYKNLPQLSEKLLQGAVRRKAREVLPLEAPTIIDYNVMLYTEHEELYQTLLQERILDMGNDELKIADNSSALRQMALQLITNPNKFRPEDDPLDISDIAPLETLLDLIDSMPLQETKLIIFCHFKETVRYLNSVLSKFNPALVYGDSDTDKNVDKLLHDDTCRIGILNFASGGAGFNLQPVCYLAVVYEAIGSPGMLEQGFGRIQRSGQTQPVRIWIFRYGMSLSSHLLNKAISRAGGIKETLNDDTCFVDFITQAVDIL